MRLQEIAAQAKPVWGGHSCPPTARSKTSQAGNVGRSIVLAISASLLVLAPYATAQRMAHPTASHPAIPHVNRPTANFAFNQSQYPYGFHHSPSRTSLPFPIFGDSFNLDDLYASGYPVASQPPDFLLQAANALAGPADYLGHPDMLPSANTREPSPSQPLMIELQNGNYVRVNRTPADGEARPLTSEKVDVPSTKLDVPSTKLVTPSTKLVIPSETRDPGFASTTALPPRELPPVL
jgi:hypothetical protein